MGGLNDASAGSVAARSASQWQQHKGEKLVGPGRRAPVAVRRGSMREMETKLGRSRLYRSGAYEGGVTSRQARRDSLKDRGLLRSPMEQKAIDLSRQMARDRLERWVLDAQE